VGLFVVAECLHVPRVIDFIQENTWAKRAFYCLIRHVCALRLFA
jgi:hypothetical protein